MLTVKDVAERLRISPSTVYHLVEGGALSCYRIGRGKGAIRFTEVQIEHFLESRKVEAGSLRPDFKFTHGRK